MSRTVAGVVAIMILSGPMTVVAAPEWQPEPPVERESTVLGGLRADHILIGVSNFEDSVRWYQDKLGFTEEMRWTVVVDQFEFHYAAACTFRNRLHGVRGQIRTAHY